MQVIRTIGVLFLAAAGATACSGASSSGPAGPDSGAAETGTADSGTADTGSTDTGSGFDAGSCAISTDCPSGCCAPRLDSNNHPEKPYVCKPVDGMAYDCTGPGHPCGAGLCSLLDSHSGSPVCFEPCSNVASPPDTECGSAYCIAVGQQGTCTNGISNVCQP